MGSSEVPEKAERMPVPELHNRALKKSPWSEKKLGSAGKLKGNQGNPDHHRTSMNFPQLFS
jgi:hypothetical protein